MWLDGDAQELAASALVAAYAALLAVGVLSTSIRVARLKRFGRKPPRLLARDLVLLAGHALALAAVLVPRALGDLDTVDTNPLWWVLVGGAPIAAIAVYVYYELWVIGH